MGMPIRPSLGRVAVPVDGYMVSIDHLIGGRAKKKFRDLAEKHGLHKVLRYKGTIMLDSGGFQKKDRDPVDVLELQSKFRPDSVVHMDVAGDMKKTVRNAIITRRHEESFDFDIYYVIQGNTLTEYLQCVRSLKKLGCKRFALGNLSRLSFLHRIRPIQKIIPLIKREIGNASLHLLGISDPRLISNFRCIISSFDSATAIRNATRLREVFFARDDILIYYKKPSKRPKEFFCNCPVCLIFDVFEDEYQYPAGVGLRRRIRFLRAIHNTYVWKQAIKAGQIKDAYVMRV
jgi:tRNA-guanine family transglycosylase